MHMSPSLPHVGLNEVETKPEKPDEDTDANSGTVGRRPSKSSSSPAQSAGRQSRRESADGCVIRGTVEDTANPLHKVQADEVGGNTLTQIQGVQDGELEDLKLARYNRGETSPITLHFRDE